MLVRCMRPNQQINPILLATSPRLWKVATNAEFVLELRNDAKSRRKEIFAFALRSRQKIFAWTAATPNFYPNPSPKRQTLAIWKPTRELRLRPSRPENDPMSWPIPARHLTPRNCVLGPQHSDSTPVRAPRPGPNSCPPRAPPPRHVPGHVPSASSKRSRGLRACVSPRRTTPERARARVRESPPLISTRAGRWNQGLD